jgi:uncharacterized protein
MRLRDLTAVLLLALCGAAHADGGRHSLWVVQGKHNTLTLVGSVHALPAAAHDLPVDVWRAYEHAKAVVMEVDLGDSGVGNLLELTQTLGVLPEGQTLEGVLGPRLYADFAAHVRRIGLEPEILARVQPWLAAVMLEQMELASLGLDASAGVDEQIAQRAAVDRKPLIGLETMEEQLGLFAHLSMDEQRQYLKGVLEEEDDFAAEFDALIAAWRSGDARALEQMMGEEFKDSPGLFRTLTTERNQKWMKTLTGLLGEDQDYLVVVGALHLVGRDGLVELLRRQGYAVVQH